jgi:predicted metalloprotease with PDZ domain
VTDTWGRRYWGGALFWFVADVEIRKRTGGARSLDDALLAVNGAGGNVSQRWDTDRVLALADKAIGADVLVPLRQRMGHTPVVVDLATMWKELGVAQAGGKMVYDDAAPLAALRRGIVAGKRR